jgi:hypothetical protein
VFFSRLFSMFDFDILHISCERREICGRCRTPVAARLLYVQGQSLLDLVYKSTTLLPNDGSPPSGVEASPKRLNSRKLKFATESVWVQIPDIQPTKI